MASITRLQALVRPFPRKVAQVRWNIAPSLISRPISTSTDQDNGLRGKGELNPTTILTSNSKSPLEQVRVANVDAWTIGQVAEWAAKQRDILPEDIGILIKNRVSGNTLLSLTTDELMKLGFPYGPAASLGAAIEKLKSPAVSGEIAMGLQKGLALWTALRERQFEHGDGYIKLKGDTTWLLEKDSVLFERQCDKDLFDKISALEEAGKDSRGAVVTGNPGIGKSWFLMYCLYRFSQQDVKRSIVYQHSKLQRGWLFSADGSVLYFATDKPWPDQVYTALVDPHSIFLFEPAGEGREPLQVSAFTIVASSPNVVHYKEFLKRTQNRFLMPCWSYDEISKAVQFYPQEGIAEWEERYNKFGGVPRYIFGSKVFDAQLDEAIDKANLDELLKTLGGPEGLKEQSHKLFHYLPNDNYIRYSIEFASLYVRDSLMSKLAQYEHPLLRGVALSTGGHGVFGSLTGFLFELLMHADLSKAKGPLEMRSLVTDDVQYFPPSDYLKPLLIEEHDKIPESVQPGIYYRPKQKNFPVVDSLLRYGDQVYGFQATVAQNHPVKLEPLRKLIQSIKVPWTSFNIVFVTTPSTFPRFQKQHYINRDRTIVDNTDLGDIANIKQWVLELPLAIGTPLGDYTQQASARK